MTESRRPRDFVYVYSDIPPAMTIRAWRAQRAANRAPSDRPLRLACGTWVRAAVIAPWHALARTLDQPRIARVRARGGRHRASRPAAPPSHRTRCAPPASGRLQTASRLAAGGEGVRVVIGPARLG